MSSCQAAAKGEKSGVWTQDQCLLFARSLTSGQCALKEPFPRVEEYRNLRQTPHFHFGGHLFGRKVV